MGGLHKKMGDMDFNRIKMLKNQYVISEERKRSLNGTDIANINIKS